MSCKLDNTMKHQLILTLIFISLLSACNSKADEESGQIDNVEKTSIKQHNNDVEFPIQPIKKKLTNTVQKGKSIWINKQKFKLLSDEIMKGAKVYNLSIKQVGVIKGTIVVVTKSSTSLVNAKKIAKNTFRLIPNKEETLHDLYKNLIKHKEYKTIELEIDYSPISTAPLM